VIHEKKATEEVKGYFVKKNNNSEMFKKWNEQMKLENVIFTLFRINNKTPYKMIHKRLISLKKL